jgi:hypothetical protein
MRMEGVEDGPILFDQIVPLNSDSLSCASYYTPNGSGRKLRAEYIHMLDLGRFRQ